MTLRPPSAASTGLVTGASSGIGADIARELASRGWGVTLVARREERLKALADELATIHGVRTEVVAADLADPESRQAMVDEVAARGLDVEILVNNAGFGTGGSVHEGDRAAEVAMIRTNVEALADLTYAYVPQMVQRGSGAILNVASTAAFQPLPGSATYAATKAFVLALSEAMHEELKGTGVTTTAVCPGPVRTPFVDIISKGESESVSSMPSFVWMTSEDTAKAAVDGMLRGRRVVIPGRLNQLTALASTHTPHEILLPVVRRFWPFA